MGNIVLHQPLPWETCGCGNRGTWFHHPYFFLLFPFSIPYIFPFSCIHLSNIEQSWGLRFEKAMLQTAAIHSTVPAPGAAGSPRCVHPALRRWHHDSSRPAVPLYRAAVALGAFLFSLLLHFHLLLPLQCSILGGRPTSGA